MITLRIHDQLQSFLENLIFNINPNIAKIKSSYSFIYSAVSVQDKAQPQELLSAKGLIEYRNVDFSYGNFNKKILNDFSLKIAAGEKIGIIGTSGAGKTTLIKCLLRYFDVSSGGIFVDGYDIRDLSQNSLRASISVIPQDINMFHRNIRDNLKLAKIDASEEEIISACKKARIHDDILSMPYGDNTIVGERGVKLSGGQRQRIAIARAILKNAPIFILDEATSSLDIPTEKSIQNSINEIWQTTKSTVITIAHRLSTLKSVDRIIVLENGRIIESGTLQSLSNNQDSFYNKLAGNLY